MSAPVKTWCSTSAVVTLTLGKLEPSARPALPVLLAFDLPRINYGRCNERPYRYVWGTGWGESGWLESVVKVDLERGESSEWSEPGSYAGEPVFVAQPGAHDEDAGVLLSIVLDGERGTSSLVVLDAATLEQLARAEAPHHIPFGFHGQFAAV